jgi:hypothetical protein
MPCLEDVDMVHARGDVLKYLELGAWRAAERRGGTWRLWSLLYYDRTSLIYVRTYLVSAEP